MIEKGVIVSVQNYTQKTTQELAKRAIDSGAIGIRTDRNIKAKNVIGLEKNDREFYITTTKDSLLRVSKWADYIAIDSRKGNYELDYLYAICHVNEIRIVADIEDIEDVKNILYICNRDKIKLPVYFATTFSNKNIELIQEISMITDIPIIAEGGYTDKEDIQQAKRNGVNNICIGAGLDIGKLTEKFVKDMEC